MLFEIIIFHGGGLYSWDTDSIMIHNSLFTANYASEHGGGMRIGGSGSFFKISNSIVRYNSTGTYDGGGIELEGDHKKVIIHTNIESNNSPQGRYGSGIYANANADSLLIMNSIIWTGYQSTGTGWSSIWLNGDKAVGYNNHIEVSSGSNFEFSRSGNNIFSDDNPFVTYELADNSQAIGQGKSSIQFDGETITPHGKDFLEMIDQGRQVPIQTWVLWKMIYQNLNIIVIQSLKMELEIFFS